MRHKVLLTGATGFIGRNIMRELLNDGYEVVSVSRSCFPNELSRKYEKFIQSRALTLYFGDIADEAFMEAVADEVKSCDVIIHAAASIDVRGIDNDIIKSNIVGANNVINLGKQLSVSNIVYFSSLPIIGCPEIIPIDENHPIKPRTLYHITKYAGEMMFDVLTDISCQVLRITSPIGVGMNQGTFIPAILRKLNSNECVELIGEGKRVQNYIDVRDIVSIVMAALDNTGKNVYVAGSSISYSNYEVVKICKEVTKSDSDIVLCDKFDAESNNKWIVNISKMAKELNYIPKYSLRETIEWMVSQNEDSVFF